jgi:hypothetical protein
MPADYTYPIDQCDVPPERRPALRAYRDKRRQWLEWIDGDEHHAIWLVLSSMIWRDVSFRVLTHLATADENSSLNASLVAEALLEGHVANQVLAIRRLTDRRRDIISVRRLVTDLRSHFHLLTRENYVCFDGLPYDYAAVEHKVMMEHVGKGFFWGATSGPRAHSTSRMAHEQFDKLSGIEPANRSRENRLPRSLLDAIEGWLDGSGADELANWSHAFLAHAGGPDARKRIEHLTVTGNKITDATRALARATEAISAWLLFAGGRTNSLMPVAQFDQFEKLDQPIMRAGNDGEAQSLWDQLSAERDRYLDGVDVDLLGRRSACSKAADQDRPSVDKLEAVLADREWLDDPDAKADKVIAEWLQELRGSGDAAP